MKRVGLVKCWIVLGLIFSANCVQAQSKANGKLVFRNTCLSCHQEDGRGVPGINPPLVKTDWVLGDKTRLIQVVLKGLKEKLEIQDDIYTTPMPSQAQLSDQQIADVLTFIRSSFGNKASAIKPEDVKKVREGN